MTAELGLVRGVWRLPGKGANRVAPTPFLLYEAELVGRSELKTIQALESLEVPLRLHGLPLYASLYVHELLVRLLPLGVVAPDLFTLYQWFLQSLVTQAPLAPLLRRFEVGLFDELGVALNLAVTGRGDGLDSTQLYQFDYRYGLRPYYGDKPKSLPVMFVQGQLALSYANGQWANKAILEMAKLLHRGWLDYLLQGKPLMARRLLPKPIYDGDRHYGVPLFRLPLSDEA
jgi:DNA repair protein RecO (recombination protein O)